MRWLSMLVLAVSSLELQAGQLAIIIDDIGYNLDAGRRAADLSGDYTLAVLPFTPHGRELAERAYRRGKEIMLHAPMSNEQHLPLGKGGLESGMSRETFLQVLERNLADIPHVRGVNNHTGSQLTQEEEPMRWLMAELKQRGLYFVDSRTTAKTRAQAMAEAAGLPNRKRDVFLDDRPEPAHVASQLELAMATARRQGSAVAIGHPYPSTLAALEKIAPLLEKYAITLVKASLLMPSSRPSVNAGQCLAPPLSLWAETPPLHDPFSLPPALKWLE
ncbi:divergent polysaccharide deacetylase family protein [Cellvibrio japonicus]|nr:divergent polysaccharide deacetylase family protein [Cellvibrio japonicus]QEI17901.1 divergent polysaccharide deacetylase family protein [Cellvibrio japonicus]QEI21477.1 divergent polysaccharide deacetylase family protein [Cellvibrio japonicus]